MRRLKTHSFPAAGFLRFSKRAVKLLLASAFASMALFHMASAATVTINTNIASDTTWSAANTYYVTSNISVNSGITLTIEPGTVVKMANVSFTVLGTLTSVGASGSPIYFTSKNDNAVGNIISGSTGNPAKGDWNQLQFNNVGSNASHLEYAVVRYMANGVLVNYSNVTVKNSEISKSTSYGIFVDGNASVTPLLESNTVSDAGQGIYTQGANPTVRNNSFAGNSVAGAYLNSGAPLFTGNTLTSNTGAGLYVSNPTNNSVVTNNTVSGNYGKGLDCRSGFPSSAASFSGNVFSGNGVRSRYCNLDPLLDGSPGNNSYTSEPAGTYLEVHSFSMMGTNSGSLSKMNVPIVVHNGGSTASGSRLSIAAGNVFRMAGGSISVGGTLTAVGTASEPIVFTSKNDNAAGGNLVGISSGAPAKGDWNQLQFNNVGSNASRLEYAVVRYMANGVLVNYSNVTVKNSEISKSTSYGIFVDGNASVTPLLESNTVSDAGQGIYTQGANPTVRNNSFAGNSVAGAYLNSGAPLFTGNVVTGNAIGVQFANSANSSVVTFNTIAKNTGVGLYVTSTNGTVKNNISYGNNYGIQCTVALGANLKYNLFGNNTSGQQNGTNCTLDGTNLAANPSFVDYANNNYELSSGSPAINSADPAMGNNPISGNAYDIGAKEFLPGTIKTMQATILNPQAKDLQYEWSFITDPSGGGIAKPSFTTAFTGATSSLTGSISSSFMVKYRGTYRIKISVIENGAEIASGENGFVVP